MATKRSSSIGSANDEFEGEDMGEILEDAFQDRQHRFKGRGPSHPRGNRTHLQGKDVANASGTAPDSDPKKYTRYEPTNPSTAREPGAGGVGARLNKGVADPYGKMKK